MDITERVLRRLLRESSGVDLTGLAALIDIELPQDQRLTPDDPTDDCILQDPKGEDNPINYSYKAEGWETGALRSLRAVHRQVMAEIPPEFQEVFIAKLETGAMAFWKNNYAG